MSKKDLGHIFVMIGMAFLMVSFIATTSTVLWGIALGVSIISNIVGVVIITQLKTPKQKVSVT